MLEIIQIVKEEEIGAKFANQPLINGAWYIKFLNEKCFKYFIIKI